MIEVGSFKGGPMAIHDWNRAPAGYFHHFHQAWSVAICRALNAGRLPSGYFAMIERTTFGVVPDVVTMNGSSLPRSPRERRGAVTLTEAPPRTRFVSQSTEEEAYAARANRIAVRDPYEEVVAIVEIISPGNKSSRHAMKSLVDKAVDQIRQGINLLIIDLLPPTPRDPQGIHPKIWSELADEDFVLPVDKRLTLASYAAGVPIRAFVEPVAVGDSLPDMPLFLDPVTYVPTPLEESYQVTWRDCPEEFRERITGTPSTGAAPEEGSPRDSGS
jgi:hypothetical protein